MFQGDWTRLSVWCQNVRYYGYTLAENCNFKMAGEGDGKFDPRRAVSLLQEATKLLSEYPCSSSDSSQHAQSSHSTVESANQSTTGNKIVDTTSGNFSRERVLGNFRNLLRRMEIIAEASVHLPSQLIHGKKGNQMPYLSNARLGLTHFFVWIIRSNVHLLPLH